MEKYDIVKEIGSGTFGSVLKAVNKATGELVAVKQMKQRYYSWDECVRLPEVQALRKFSSHPNIVRLKEVVRENNILYFVFEFLDGDLLGRMKDYKALGGGLPHHMVKSYTLQLLQSLQFLHRCGYFHRDLKPENILIKKTPGDVAGVRDVIKLADFGLVKEIRARPPFTDYVSTRWYRAPEILLQDRSYSSPVDLWAVGCMIAELYTTRPLFPGSNEVDQMFKIVSVIGVPTQTSWPEGLALARKINYRFPTVAVTPLEKVLPSSIPAEAIDLMKELLVMDPRKRLTAQLALNHPYFHSGLEEDSRIRPTNTNYFGETPTGSSRVLKAPSAPSPHHTKTVEWKTAKVAEELANPQLAKPSSSESSRLPPVSIAPRPSKDEPTSRVPKVTATSVTGGGQQQSTTSTTSQNQPSGSALPPMTFKPSGEGRSGNSPVNKFPPISYSSASSGATSSPITQDAGFSSSNPCGVLKPFDASRWQSGSSARDREGGSSPVDNKSTAPYPKAVLRTTSDFTLPPPGSQDRRSSESGTTGSPGVVAGGGRPKSLLPVEKAPQGTQPGGRNSGVDASGGRSPTLESLLGLPPSSGSGTGGTTSNNGGKPSYSYSSIPPSGRTKQPSPTKDIVDQALEELLNGASPGSGKALLFDGAALRARGTGAPANVGTRSPSPLSELLGNSMYRSGALPPVASTSNTGNGHPTTTNATDGAGLRDRTQVPLRRPGQNSDVAPISPSVATILEQRRKLQQQQQLFSSSQGKAPPHAGMKLDF
jgi:protein kinase